jgi:hypothetical protein
VIDLGLLQQIIDGAMDGSQPVSNLLRSVRVLAVRSHAGDLAEWINKERDGYAPDDVLPEYRGPFATQVIAQFTGPFNSEMTNVPVPSFGFPDHLMRLFEVSFYRPVAELEHLIDGDKQILTSPWTGNEIVIANRLARQGKVATPADYSYATAHRRVPQELIISAVESVRNRILDLALELEQVAPELNNPDVNLQKNREQVSAAFHTVIYTNNAYVGTNTTSQSQFNMQVTPGDIESLGRFLDGISELRNADKDELIRAADAAKSQGPEAIEEDGPLQNAIKKVGGAASKLGQEAVSVTIKALLQHWLGPAA